MPIQLFFLTYFSFCSFQSEQDNVNRNVKIHINFVEVNVEEFSELNIHENIFQPNNRFSWENIDVQLLLKCRILV